MRYIGFSLALFSPRTWPYLTTRQTRRSISAQTPNALPPCAICKMEDYFNLKCVRSAFQVPPIPEKQKKKAAVRARFRIFGCADSARQT